MRLGFSACGIVEAKPVDDDARRTYQQYIDRGCHASMEYLTRYPSQRFDPSQLLPGCKTIITLALNYYPIQLLPADSYQISYYAYGADYHDVMRSKLRQLVAAILPYYPSLNYKLAVDTAPVLERYWAVRSGMGWVGKNHTLIVPRQGSYVFLGEILIDEAIPAATAKTESPCVRTGCGSCQRCIDACPTHALGADGTFDSRRCLSYLTIEHRGDFEEEQHRLIAGQPTPYYIYGCDRCQKACPHNMHAVPTTQSDFSPHPDLLQMTPDDWHHLSREQYQLLFRHSAVKRAKYEGLIRNIQAIQH